MEAFAEGEALSLQDSKAVSHGGPQSRYALGTEIHGAAMLRAEYFNNSKPLRACSVPPPCKLSVSLRVRGVIYGSLRRR